MTDIFVYMNFLSQRLTVFRKTGKKQTIFNLSYQFQSLTNFVIFTFDFEAEMLTSYLQKQRNYQKATQQDLSTSEN